MGNTALSEILSKGAVPDKTVKAKRGVATHLGAMTEDLKALARAELNAKETDIVELDPHDIEFSESINHRQQGWLSEHNQSFLKLVRSIDLAGQKMPIMVRPKGEGCYELIYGSRRRQAALHLGTKVKAIIAHGVSDKDAHELAILENTNHSGLSPIEEARAVLAYKERNAPIADRDVAVVFTKSRQWVGFQVSFANLDARLIEQCANPWTITERSTRELRSTWNNSVSERNQWTRALEKLKAENKKLPFRQLMEYLKGAKPSTGTEIIRDKEGRVVAEVSESTIKSGRRIRRICLYEDFDKKLVAQLTKALSEDIDTQISS